MSLSYKYKYKKKSKNRQGKLSKYTASPMQVDEFQQNLRDPKQRLLRWDRTSLVFQEMKYRAENEKNLVIFIKGPTGIGKSWTALGLWETWKAIVKELKKEPNLYITFNRWQTTQKTRKAEPTDFYLQDEDTILSGYGAKAARDALQNLINTMRQYQLCFILICPEEINDLSGAHFSVEVCLNNPKDRDNLVKVFNHKGRLLGHASLPVLKDPQLLAEYEQLKKENMSRLLSSAGRDSEQINIEQIYDDVKVVMEFAQERGWNLKNLRRIKTACRFAGISGQNEYIDILATFIEMELEAEEDIGTIIKMQQEEKKMSIREGSIVDKYRKAVKEYLENNDLEQAAADLDLNHFEGKSLNEIADIRKVSKKTISSNIKSAKRKLNKVSGFLWEEAIFSWVLESVRNHAKSNAIEFFTGVNTTIIDEAFPIKEEKDIFFFGTDRLPLTDSKKKTLGKIFSEMSSPIPPLSVFYSLFLSSGLDFLFIWQGGTSTVDFLFFSRSCHFVFDAKVSHQTHDKHNRLITSLHIKSEKLVPQSDYLKSNPAATAAVLFWSPKIGDRFISHPGPGESVTANPRCRRLEKHLQTILSAALPSTSTSASAPNTPNASKKKQRGEVGLEKRTFNS